MRLKKRNEKLCKKLLTGKPLFVRIIFAAERAEHAWRDIEVVITRRS